MSVIATIEAKLHDLWAALEAEGHALAAKAKDVLDELRADAPKLEAEAASDAADVAKTAETQGVTPALAEAEADTVKLGEDAVHDVAAAVEGGAKPQPEPVHSPAQTVAVIAGETAVASEPTA